MCVSRIAEARNAVQQFAIASEKLRMIGLTQQRGQLDERVKHALQIKGRTADDLEHARGCCLLLERLVALTGEQRNPLSYTGGQGFRRRATFAVLRRLKVLRRCGFVASPPVLLRSLIAFAKLRTSMVAAQTGIPEGAINVRFGS